MSKPSELGALKIGSYILLPVGGPNEEPCRIVEYDTSKPGKHGAKQELWEWESLTRKNILMFHL
jgi:translation elongation factor P/translation initiation factor 5A